MPLGDIDTTSECNDQSELNIMFIGFRCVAVFAFSLGYSKIAYITMVHEKECS